MYSWLIKRLVAYLYGSVSGRHLRLPLLLLSHKARFVFPRDNSFGGEYVGKPAIETGMRRFGSLHRHFSTPDASAAGQPWNMRVFMRFSDRIVAPDGYVYDYERLEYTRIRWGLIHEIRVSLDTEKVAALDRHLPQASG